MDQIKTGLKQTKPKRQSLISNILNRIDDKSLAVKKFISKEERNTLLYWESKTNKHLLANKDILSFLSYEELEQLLDGHSLQKDFSIESFKFGEHLPEKQKEIKLHREAVLVTSYKEVDKIGTSKGESEIFKSKK